MDDAAPRNRCPVRERRQIVPRQRLRHLRLFGADAVAEHGQQLIDGGVISRQPLAEHGSIDRRAFGRRGKAEGHDNRLVASGCQPSTVPVGRGPGEIIPPGLHHNVNEGRGRGAPRAEGDTLAPRAEGDALAPCAVGDALAPRAKGGTLVPRAEGDTLAPRRRGATMMVDANAAARLDQSAAARIANASSASTW